MQESFLVKAKKNQKGSSSSRSKDILFLVHTPLPKKKVLRKQPLKHLKPCFPKYCHLGFANQAFRISVDSSVRPCRNPMKYVFRPHKFKNSASPCPQKEKNRRVFERPSRHQNSHSLYIANIQWSRKQAYNNNFKNFNFLKNACECVCERELDVGQQRVPKNSTWLIMYACHSQSAFAFLIKVTSFRSVHFPRLNVTSWREFSFQNVEAKG